MKRLAGIITLLLLLLSLAGCDGVVLLTVPTENPQKEEMCRVKFSFINRNDKEVQIGCRTAYAPMIRKLARDNGIKILGEMVKKELIGSFSSDDSFLNSLYPGATGVSSSRATYAKICYFTFSADDVNAVVLKY